MTDIYKKVNWKQISLSYKTSNLLETLTENFKYNKKLKRTKIIEMMMWQYVTIKNTNRSVIFKNNKFEVIENDKN